MRRNASEKCFTVKSKTYKKHNHTHCMSTGERKFDITVVSWVSVHGCLNIIRDFGPHGRLPGIKIPYVCIEAATLTP